MREMVWEGRGVGWGGKREGQREREVVNTML